MLIFRKSENQRAWMLPSCLEGVSRGCNISVPKQDLAKTNEPGYISKIAIILLYGDLN
jgi:hypothetical protein